MGLFDFFSKPVTPSEQPQIPTISVPKELHQTYRLVFLAEFKTIMAFSSDEVLEMLRVIEEGDGGHLNQGHYLKAIYEQFFRTKQWQWPWYEYWDTKFQEFGAYPSDWPYCEAPDNDPSFFKIIFSLNVQELKQGLTDAGVKFSSAAKKKELQTLATSNNEISKSIAQSKIGRTCAHNYAQKQGYGLYLILMRTLSFWAKQDFDQKRRDAIGLKKTKILIISTEFEPFVNLALLENSESRCPLYPGDRTIRVACRD